MENVQFSSRIVDDYLTLAGKRGAVELKNGELRSASKIPAKLGFFRSILYQIIGYNPAKISADTRTAFLRAMRQAYGCLVKDIGYAPADSSKQLTSREIKVVLDKADRLKAQKDKISDLDMQKRMMAERGGNRPAMLTEDFREISLFSTQEKDEFLPKILSNNELLSQLEDAKKEYETIKQSPLDLAEPVKASRQAVDPHAHLVTHRSVLYSLN